LSPFQQDTADVHQNHEAQVLLDRPTGSPDPMTAVIWRQLLAAASTADEVISVARDFVAGIDPVALAKIPHDCHPRRLFDAHDIGSYAYDLMRHQYQGADAGVAETVQQLAAFFSQATIRLSQIATPRHADKAWKLFG
jgi:hypothetical protein